MKNIGSTWQKRRKSLSVDREGIMEKADFVASLVIVLLVLFVVFATNRSAEIRQELYLKKTGQSISRWDAMNYPDEFFTDAVVRVEVDK